jgi:protocatechuate 4,5-dioxygenase alpha chain
MTRYALDKVLWNYAREPQFKAAFDADPAAAVAGRELSEAECSALSARDLRAIFQLGAHPFLLYSFAIASNGGWSMEMMKDYVAKLEGLELRDIET